MKTFKDLEFNVAISPSLGYAADMKLPNGYYIYVLYQDNNNILVWSYKKGKRKSERVYYACSPEKVTEIMIMIQNRK